MNDNDRLNLLRQITMSTDYYYGDTVNNTISIDDFIKKNGVSKILDHIDEDEIQNYLRAKKIRKITKI